MKEWFKTRVTCDHARFGALKGMEEMHTGLKSLDATFPTLSAFIGTHEAVYRKMMKREAKIL